MAVPFKNYFLVLLLLPNLQITGSWAQDSYSIANYNVFFDTPSNSGNLWEDRGPHLINLIRFHEMDIIGTREGLYSQVEDNSKDLNFPYIGVSKDSGKKEGEFCAVFYNPEKFQLLDKGTFWLSPSLEKPSKDRDAAINRICSWGKFETSEGDLFYVFNVHYDTLGQTASEESSKLLHEKITEINKEHLPCILTGDFYGDESKPAYQESNEEETLHNSKGNSLIPSHGGSRTFHPFNWDLLPEKRIDPVFVSSNFSDIRHANGTVNHCKKFPSNHFPVKLRPKIGKVL
ncbi:endonuclease/exonuclease/phosphatase family protein [Cyclobacterium jeungdonense]|uniref:Endonuclease/exonuclease/phosphatase family protein n=1 Tax=Cyclobacterium jeungdonense TaxID=708087 RepID=A0ABT8C3S1_9BACT|nr:endonuclease/exonuclease/phosphatase family protein [Cyclobacterium jeungdonense]MDN3686737.1 endonuclease/exonuclease/phosphatase family protein [Cyclobacterium jeungdonense]